MMKSVFYIKHTFVFRPLRGVQIKCELSKLSLMIKL